VTGSTIKLVGNEVTSEFWIKVVHALYLNMSIVDRLCGLVVGVPGYRARGPGYDSRRYQIV
jgi:hypothetical protein